MRWKNRLSVFTVGFVSLLVAFGSGAKVCGQAKQEPPRKVPPPWVERIVSSTVFDALNARFGRIPQPKSDATVSFSTTDFVANASAQTGNLWTARVTNDENVTDVETSVVAQTVGSTDYVFIGFMGDFDFDPSRNLSSWKLRLAFNKTGSSTTVMDMPMPSGFIESADPVLHESFSSSGVAPKRVYYGGLFYQGNRGASTVPQAIGVYRSDAPYTVWTGPVFVELNNDERFFLDKPDIVVSDYSGTLGHVYVTYVKIEKNDTGAVIGMHVMFSRSTDGGLTYSAPKVIATGDWYNSQQILVNPFSGRIFIVWADYVNDRILVSQSDDQGSSWTAPETAAQSVNLLMGPDNDRWINGGNGQKNINAPSVLQARFNWVANRIGLVFHQWSSPSKDTTDLYFVSKGNTGWQGPVRINSVTVNDQWMPGLDFDPNGNWMVGFFDRSNDPFNLLYEEWWTRLQPNGTILENGGPVLGVVPSNPADNHQRFVGDYQDVWWWQLNDIWADRFFLGFPQGNGQGDIYLSAVR